MNPATVVHSARGGRWSRLLNPVAAAGNLWRHRELIGSLALREISARYRASWLGWLWAILNPLALLAIYTFVFSVVFGARWGTDVSETRADFALTLFCGLLAFTLFNEVIIRAPALVADNANYVKKVVFPLEALVPASLLVALFNFAIGLAVWIVGWLVLRQAPPQATLLWLPLVLAPLLLFTLGLGWILSSVGVFVRDIGHAVALVTQVLFFATPIFYPLERVPEAYRAALAFNPLAQVVENVRRVAMHGVAPDWTPLGWTLLASAGLALFGYAFFLKSRRAFNDVL